MQRRAIGCALGLALLGCSASSSHPPAAEPPTASSIKHLVVLVQENHSFDTYFAAYCTAPTGSNPTCTTGPSCCEAGPAKDPGSGMAPVVLDDTENGTFDPNHTQTCELAEIDDGKMDMFATAPTQAGNGCGSAQNVAIADPTIMATTLVLVWGDMGRDEPSCGAAIASRRVIPSPGDAPAAHGTHS